MTNSLRITIFTPTYNRCYTLDRLYQSLCSQTDKRFVWLVIDDGSTDSTKETMFAWMGENKIQIEYLYQKNQGKSAAFNKGVELCDTELFTCVDSDDYLTEDAVEKIIGCWGEYCDDAIGILAKRSVTEVSRAMQTGVKTGMLEATREYHLKGDTMIVHKVNVLKKFKFPQFRMEKFVPEAYLYDQLDKEGKMIFLNEILYKGDYLDDGYTRNMATVIKKNPLGYEAFILQRLQNDKNLKYRFYDTVRFVAIEKVLERSFIDTIMRSKYPLLTVISYLFGILFYESRYKQG